MDFRVSDYGQPAARILALADARLRPMPLAPAGCSSPEALTELKRWKARDLFPGSFSPEGALSGLYLYFSCLDEAHKIAQDLETPEGSVWHGIMHRQEPDAGNAGYWFRHLGKHPIFPELCNEARKSPFDTGPEWDPFAFIDFCESARVRPESAEERIAMQVQLSEWQLLFDYCAREKNRE